MARGHRSRYPMAGGSIAVMPLLDRDHPMGALIALVAPAERVRARRAAPAAVDRQPARRIEPAAAHRGTAGALATPGCRRQAHGRRGARLQQPADDHFRQPAIARVASRPATRRAADMIASALRASGRGAELTSKLLAFARRQRLTPQPVDPQQTLVDIAEMMRRTLGECDPDRRQRLPGPTARRLRRSDAARYGADQPGLNARDAMPQGGVITLSVGDSLDRGA